MGQPCVECRQKESECADNRQRLLVRVSSWTNSRVHVSHVLFTLLSLFLVLSSLFLPLSICVVEVQLLVE